MPLPQTYNPQEREPALDAYWQDAGIYRFDRKADGPVYSIDTPPPTVSGYLHLGHLYSYTHADIIARFKRMSGANVFYPMGFDDDGLPTERLVEKRLGIRAMDVGREAFIAKCRQIGEESEAEYRAIWRRLGLSIDWRYTYRTIDERSCRVSQRSFIELYEKGLAYRQTAPAIWCPECHMALAQAELDDLDRESAFYTLAFSVEDGATLPIATTRPELLPACVAVFVHPGDARYAALVGRQATVPLFGQRVPILDDPLAAPEIGTGAVMCCTFGDQTDVEWWRTRNLSLRATIGRDGRMTEAAGSYAGMTTAEGRRDIVTALAEAGLLLGERNIAQSVRVHERCDTPVEYIVAQQWFIKALEFKEPLLTLGGLVSWHPASMAARYREWVETLKWDWSISRQRAFGVPIPVWYCDACGEPLLPDISELPLDPQEQAPASPCRCGGMSFTPERDVMDVWATASMTPQIVGGWLDDPALYARVFPFSLRPQAHEIIRTWAFYTMVKSYHHFGALPFENAAISGWGLAPAGSGKISKSRGGGPITPMAVMDKYSADAVRYWAASTGFGKDSVISEGKIEVGAKLVTKLWNVARFAERFLAESTPLERTPTLSPADRWILSREQRLVARVTDLLCGYDYAAAKSEVESFFWQTLADNYVEMAKERLYDKASPGHEGARYTVRCVLLTTLKLFAPFLPYVTEEIYLGLFAAANGMRSIHRAQWPEPDAALTSEAAETVGDALVAIATAVRRYKSEASISLGAELARLHLATSNVSLAESLRAAMPDLRSVTRARAITIGAGSDPDPALVPLAAEGNVSIALTR